MDEQNKDTEEQIKFTQLLKELADTQVTLAKINAQLAIRESKDQIETIVDSKSKELIEQAKKFGAKLEKIEQEYANQNADREGIVEEFEKRLAEASEEYDKILQDIMEKKAQFELDENGILLEQKRNKVKMAAENKEFAKTKQRLEKEIVQAIQVAQTTKDNVIQFGKDTRGMIITGVDNSKKVVTTYVKDTMETGKRTYRGIINKGYEIKSNMIEAAQQRLSAQQQEIQQKRQQLNMNIKEANGIEVGD